LVKGPGRAFCIILLDFDGIYANQSELCLRADIVISSEIREVKYMCSPSKLKEIGTLIPSKGRFIAFLGGGEYHHLSLLFLKRVKIPFFLLLFDKHLDALKKGGEFIRCDSWLNCALELKNLLGVIFIGRRERRFGKIHIMPPDGLKITRAIKDKAVYISIDKDILDVPLTRWGKGWLPLSELLRTLSFIPKDKVVGVDVCGEPEELCLWKMPESERINLEIVKALEPDLRGLRSFGHGRFFFLPVSIP